MPDDATGPSGPSLPVLPADDPYRKHPGSAPGRSSGPVRGSALGTLRRGARACALSAAIVVVAAACASSRQAPGEPALSPIAPGSTTAQAPLSSAPGRLSVKVPGGSGLPAVTVTDARVRLLGGGEGELVMSVRNGGSAPEHLYLVSTPDAASTSFDGPNGVDSILSPAGVLLEPGGTVSLGGHGAARVLLYGLHGTDSEHDVPFILIFANVGLVHLQALPPAR